MKIILYFGGAKWQKKDGNGKRGNSHFESFKRFYLIWISSFFYKRELTFKLQRLQLVHISVEEYYEEMEIILIKCKMEERLKSIMTRFMNDLN